MFQSAYMQLSFSLQNNYARFRRWQYLSHVLQLMANARACTQTQNCSFLLRFVDNAKGKQQQQQQQEKQVEV